MKTKMSKTFVFSPYECKAIQEYLESMAKKGWMLESLKGYKFKFTKIEPKSIKYSVEVIPNASDLDSSDSDTALEYRDYCESAGWKYICGKGKIQIFYAEDDCDVISIHTDEREKFNLVFKSSFWENLLKVFWVLILIYNSYLMIFSGDISFYLSSNISLLGSLANAILIAVTLTEILSFVSWSINSKKRINQGLDMTYNSLEKIERKHNIRLFINVSLILGSILIIVADRNQSSNNFFIIILAMITIFTSFIAHIIIKKYLKSKDYSRFTKNIINFSGIIVFSILSMLFFMHVLFNSSFMVRETTLESYSADLSLQNFNIIKSDYDDLYKTVDTSILGKRTFYSDFVNDDESLTYTLFESNYPLAINAMEKQTLRYINNIIYSHDPESKFSEHYMVNDTKIYPSPKSHSYIIVSDSKVLDIRNNFNNISDEDFLEIIINDVFN